MAQASELTTSLHALKISRPSKAPPKSQKAPVADSWDDEDLDDNDDEDNTNSSTPTSTSTETESTLSLSKPPSEGPLAPPPTPASPTSGFTYDLPYSSLIPTSSISSSRSKGTSPEGGSGASTPPSSRRPDKTTAVAGRLIAGALGVKAPRRTEEEREYDRVMRGKEKERREREREERGRRAEEGGEG